MSDVWLSRISVDARSYAGRTALADVQQMHRSVMAGFDSVDAGPARATLGVLYRVEGVREPHVLLQSSTSPDQTGLPDGFVIDGMKDVNLERLASASTRVRYRITANTVIQRNVPGKRGPREPLYGAAAVEWWAARAERCGLELAGDVLGTKSSASGRKGKTKIALCGHRFDGVATVVDPPALAEALRTGLGRGRAYGFGLLSIAPLA